MPDLPSSEEPAAKPDYGPPPATPRWVKWFGIVVAVLALLFVILHLTGHGMGNHFPASHPPTAGAARP